MIRGPRLNGSRPVKMTYSSPDERESSSNFAGDGQRWAEMKGINLTKPGNRLDIRAEGDVRHPVWLRWMSEE